MHELWTVKDNKMYNISPLVGSINWGNNINELGEKLDFDIAFNDDRYFPLNPIDLGNLMILKNNDEILRSIVVTEQRQGRGAIIYNSFDYAFYLNKSKGVYQFNKVLAKKAITKILSDFNIQIGNIVDIPYVVNKIYNDKNISDIIKDILELATNSLGIKYRFEMRLGKLYIEKQDSLLITGVFKLASNLEDYNIINAISNPSRKRSIEDMRNSIKIVSKDKIVAEIKNESLINQYGLLQEIQSIDENIAQAKNIAKNLLKDLGKIFEENSFDCPGDDRVRAGRLLEVEEPVTGMTGIYLIEDVNHSVKNGIHTMSLSLGVL